MTIEITGAGFGNKGAELMLRTTLARIRAADPDVRVAVEPTNDALYERRAAERISHIFPAVSLYPGGWRRYMHKLPILREAIFRATLLPPGVGPLCGLVRRADCNALVDLSGYAYGDAFSPLRIRNGADRARAHARRGNPVVLMPQMFGPFEKPEVRSQFLRLIESAKLIFARERPSYDAVHALIGDDPRLRQCPDITIFSPPVETDLPPVDGPYACIVPNERMLDQGGAEWGDSYLDRLTAVANRMLERGIKPMVVVHSADPGDTELAKRLLGALHGKGELFHHADPFVLKAFIARARFLVGSRFHSIVAALSSGVPGVALGWAHKYEALAADFHVPELQHRASDDIDHLLSLTDQLCDPDTRERFAGVISNAKAEMRPQVDAAWREVMAVLGLEGAAGSS